MKKSLLFSTILVLLFSGCTLPKAYVNVDSKDAATLQLIPKSKTLIIKDYLVANISDYSKGCQKMVDLGVLGTDSDTPSVIVKLPAEKSLLVKVKYYTDNIIETTDFVLRTEKKKNYIIEYVKKEVKGKTRTDFYVYMKDGKKNIDIPEKRLRDFNNRECM